MRTKVYDATRTSLK